MSATIFYGKALFVTDEQLLADSDLLLLCAILRWFDADILAALSGRSADELARFLASDEVAPALELAGAYRLRSDLQAEALARLRAEHPQDELALHTRAFEYFLGRMKQPNPASPDTDEEQSFYHLAELRNLLWERREWHTIARHVAAARAVGPRQPQHLRRLTFYEGFVAIRTQDYDRGEIILTALLDRLDLENDIRIDALNALGAAYYYQTRYDRSLAFYQQVHTFARQIGDLLFQGIALLNMNMIYREIGQHDQALNLSIQSLQLFRELRNSHREAHALYEVGNNAMQLGRWQIAQEHFREAIKLYEALGVMADLANLYWCQGFLYHMLGDEPRSEAAYLQGLPIAQSPEYGQPEVAMDTLLLLGFLYQTQGRWDEALESYNQATILAKQLRNRQTLAFIFFRRGDVLKRQRRPDAAMAAYQQAIEAIESLRGATEGEEIKIGLLGSTGWPIVTTQQIYESMVLLCLEQNYPVDAFAYVERARSRAFLDVLAKKSSELYDSFDQPVATLAEVQSKLPSDALLLEYFTTGVLPRGESLVNQIPPENTRLREHLTLPPRTLIFAITHDRFEVHQTSLDPNALRPQPGDPSPGRRLLRERLLNHLHAGLLAPVAHLLHSHNLLYLIPHGPLHYVPFAALRPSNGDALIRDGGPSLAFAPSATVLLRNCLGRPSSRAMTTALALGYNDLEGEPLRYAEAEALHVAELLGGAALAGPEPKRERLVAAARQARWLHFSGHAIYNPRDPLESELRTGQGETLSARAIVGELDLDADLVTLSACTSGVSQVVAGDELLGLQRAFLYAGARAVLCTLWEAADFVTLLLMDRFYADLRLGRSAAAALRDAQTALRAMTGRDLMATLDRWRVEDPQLIAALGELPAIADDQLDQQLYADPTWWAPFLLVGKAD